MFLIWFIAAVLGLAEDRLALGFILICILIINGIVAFYVIEDNAYIKRSVPEFLSEWNPFKPKFAVDRFSITLLCDFLFGIFGLYYLLWRIIGRKRG